MSDELKELGRQISELELAATCLDNYIDCGKKYKSIEPLAVIWFTTIDARKHIQSGPLNDAEKNLLLGMVDEIDKLCASYILDAPPYAAIDWDDMEKKVYAKLVETRFPLPDMKKLREEHMENEYKECGEYLKTTNPKYYYEEKNGYDKIECCVNDVVY